VAVGAEAPAGSGHRVHPDCSRRRHDLGGVGVDERRGQGQGRHRSGRGRRHGRRAGRARRRSGGVEALALQVAAEVGAQVAGRGVPVVRILGQALEDDGLERLGDRRIDAAGRDHLVTHVLGGDLDRVGPVEGRLADDHLVEDAAQRVDVAAGIDPVPAGLLGREVGGGAHDGTGLGEVAVGRVGDGPGDAEVDDLDLALGREQHVAGLDVAVDHATRAVGVAQGRRHLARDLDGPIGVEPAVGADELGQAVALHVLHDDEVGAVGLAPVVGPDDVGVAQAPRRLGLAAEPLDEAGVGGQGREQDLDRHRAVEHLVMGEVHLGHAASPEPPMQLVAIVEDHWRHPRHNQLLPLSRRSSAWSDASPATARLVRTSAAWPATGPTPTLRSTSLSMEAVTSEPQTSAPPTSVRPRPNIVPIS
jgi:hypothetical protein